MRGNPWDVMGIRVKLNNWAKNEEIKRPKSNSLEMKPPSSSSFQNPLKLRAKISKSDHSVSLVRIADQLGDSPFSVVHHRLVPTFSIVVLWAIRWYGTASRNCSGSAHWIKRQSKTLRRSLGLHFFQTQVQLFNKGVSNSATQDSIINAHNKTQFTYAKIKCALKDSSCDSLISTNLMLTILASNASSSSTVMFKCPHTKNDSMFTQWFHSLNLESDATLTLTKKYLMHAFTHRFSHIFQSTFILAHSRSKRSFKGL
ncbi:hypothetical protein H5410_061362 [Solanum commersonii]|uniref:Uncharacterized protein n=1 Tax=Solanum commersonii TaxID=4109 RepID=A0A9J5W8N0_SOLCO|nr:hypothetical protein H5410_061362 [Solanum commersonii]